MLYGVVENAGERSNGVWAEVFKMYVGYAVWSSGGGVFCGVYGFLGHGRRERWWKGVAAVECMQAFDDFAVFPAGKKSACGCVVVV